MQATILPKYVNDPKPGKKNYSIKDENGAYWSCPPAIAQQIKPGQAVMVEYEVNEYQGKSYSMIKGLAGSMAKPAPQTNSQAPAPRSAGSKSIAEEASMFAMGFLNRLYAGTGQFPGHDILEQQIRDCRGAWLMAMGHTKAVAKPAPVADFDDDIPL